MHLPKLVAFAATAVLATTVTASAQASPPGPIRPPVTISDNPNDVSLEPALDDSDLTKRQAKAAEIEQLKVTVGPHNGERSVRLETTLKRTLGTSKAYTQIIRIFFDDELNARTIVDSGQSRFVSTYGGGAGPGCTRIDGRVVGRKVIQWVPSRCLDNRFSDLSVESYLRDNLPRKKQVSYDTVRRYYVGPLK